VTAEHPRVSYPSTAGDEIVLRLATTADLLIVCDFEGTLAELCGDGAIPVDGSMRVVSELATLPRTSVAIIAHDSVAHLRIGDSDGLGEAVTVIERSVPAALNDGSKAAMPGVFPRKDLAIDGLLTNHSPSLIFYAGDDETDELVFAALGADDIGCKIGPGATSAAMRLPSSVELVSFLESVLKCRRRQSVAFLTQKL
jgi:trehalose-6-phosphatase